MFKKCIGQINIRNYILQKIFTRLLNLGQSLSIVIPKMTAKNIVIGG